MNAGPTDDPSDRLALAIGRVAQAHVQLDFALRQVHQTLMSPGLGMFLSGGVLSVARLIEDIQIMLAKADLDPEILVAAKSALAAARDANEVRNRVVHDMWLPHPELQPVDGQVRWLTSRPQRGHLNSVSAAGSTRDLSYVADALAAQRRAQLRVLGIHWTLWEVLPFFRGSRGDAPSNLSNWIALMTDQFDLQDDGGFAIK
jgi:hypothetical protein